MSELKILTLHIEEDKYAYYHVEQLNTKVILIHESYDKDELLKLIRSLEEKQERECPFLIIVDKDKKTPFNDLSRIGELIQKGMIPNLSKEVIKIEPLPQLTTPFISDYRPNNPHRNQKSRNCKIRRR